MFLTAVIIINVFTIFERNRNPVGYFVIKKTFWRNIPNTVTWLDKMNKKIIGSKKI